jgi:hypothetical protein
MAPIDPRDPVRRTASRGRSYLYVLPCAYEDLLKLGFSREPLERMTALHPRWYEFFDLDRGFLVETETVRDARDLELMLGHSIAEHGAPAPLIARPEAGGHTEWYRGAYEILDAAAEKLAARGYRRHAPLRPWLREALLARRELLFSWAQAMLTVDEVEASCCETPAQRTVRDLLDGYAALGIDLVPWLPDTVTRWYRLVGR